MAPKGTQQAANVNGAAQEDETARAERDVVVRRALRMIESLQRAVAKLTDPATPPGGVAAYAGWVDHMFDAWSEDKALRRRLLFVRMVYWASDVLGPPFPGMAPVLTPRDALDVFARTYPAEAEAIGEARFAQAVADWRDERRRWAQMRAALLVFEPDAPSKDTISRQWRRMHAALRSGLELVPGDF
jgi:hypothetical protein